MLNEDLRRWFREKWVDISRKKNGKHPPCGRSSASDSKYPKCRPSVRVSSETPETSGEMSKEEKKGAVRQKRSAESKVSTTGRGRKPVMTSHKKINEDCGCKHEKMKMIKKFMKKKQPTNESRFEFSMPKTNHIDIDDTFLNKKVFVYFINESNQFAYEKGTLRIASNSGLREGFDLEVVGTDKVTPLRFEDVMEIKYIKNGNITQYKVTELTEENKPTNPKLWSKAKSLAKSKFKVYPSAYANGWASKWYKKHGGGWKTVNEGVELNEELSKKDISKLKPRMKSILKNELREEIVNASHAGTMTKKEIKSRDKIAKKVKAKPIKGKDTEENARYRLATYIELRKRGAEPKGKKGKKSKKKPIKEETETVSPQQEWQKKYDEHYDKMDERGGMSAEQIHKKVIAKIGPKPKK